MNVYRGVLMVLLCTMLVLSGLMGYLGYVYSRLDFSVTNPINTTQDSTVTENVDSIYIFSGTFLGNESRNYYGDSLPDQLSVIWKFEIGGGETNPTGKELEVWKGAGWTGQPLIIEEKGSPFLLQGCYDHTLKKINAITGTLIWEYKYDDVLKGTGTIWIDPRSEDPDNRILILQGARIGLQNNLRTDTIPSYRAISYFTGKEIWRLNVKKGPSFSRDVDGSALVINDTVYIGLENGFFSVFTPGNNNIVQVGDKNYKLLLNEYPLFEKTDIPKHGGELVIESSPCIINDHVYITTGSGHVYGFNLTTRELDWDLYLGADLNGSPVVTNDNCLIVTLEKQFIKGQGGAMKIDPSQIPEKSVVWYFPTQDREFASWKGGVVGSVSVNDHYKNEFDRSLACISALDGNLYLVDHTRINDSLMVKGPDGITDYHTPLLLSTATIGPTISTPIFVEDKICAAGYSGIYIYEIVQDYQLQQKDMLKGVFESTPIAYHGKVFIASKNGYLYCLGNLND